MKKPFHKLPSIFAKLITADLRDDTTLLDWIHAATKRERPVVNNNDTDRLNVFAAAERALEVATNPVALFASIVGGHHWHLISCAQEDRAQQRLRRLRVPEWQRRQPSDGEPKGANNAADLVRQIVNRICP